MIPLRDSESPGIFPFWVFTIIAANTFIFYLQTTSSNPDAFISQYSLIPSQINFNNPTSLLPFITSQFLHGGILHILSNMWFLWIFGDNVEGRAGKILFPLLYLISGAAGAFAQYIFMTDSNIPMLGASGAIAGVLGAYFAWFPHHKVKTLLPLFVIFTIIEIPAFLMLLYWLATQIFAGVGSFNPEQDIGGVAYFAHIGGFIAGWVSAKLLNGKPHAYS
jgi:membrane associated rhomboid family serine protease